MNILYVPTKDPRLKDGGNEQRTNLLWESLKRYGKVYTILANYMLDVDSLLIEGDYPIYMQRPKEKRCLFWRTINMLLSKLSVLSVFKRKIIKVERPEDVFKGVHFDVVVTRYINPLCLYKYWEVAPLFIDIDDHPYQVYNTTCKDHLPFGLKTIGKYLTRFQTKYILSKAAGGWIANEEQLYLCGKNFGFLPNIPQMPSSEYNVESSERKNLFTVGAMGYGPNKDGVTRFLKQIWPSFHERYPDTQYFIVGKGAPEAEAKLWNSFEGVKYLGFVEDLETLYENTLATVVPVYSGGGTCIKTLEAMAYSRTCLSTKFGARGLSENIVDGEKGILLYEDLESFIIAYDKILDVKRRQEIEKQGKNFVLYNYSIDSFNNAVDDVVFNARLSK